MSARKRRRPQKCKACRSPLAPSGTGLHNWSSNHRILEIRQISSRCTLPNLECPRKGNSRSQEGLFRPSPCPSLQGEIFTGRKRAWASMEITQRYSPQAPVWSQPPIGTAMVISCKTKLQRSTHISSMIKPSFSRSNKQTRSFGIHRVGLPHRLMMGLIVLRARVESTTKEGIIPRNTTTTIHWLRNPQQTSRYSFSPPLRASYPILKIDTPR